MDSVFEKDIEKIQKGLEEGNQEVSVERTVLPEDRLRNAILGLVEKQVKEACNYDRAINLAVGSLIDKINTNELSTSELLSVVGTLANKKVDLISTTLEPFKPTPNGVSLLLPPVEKKKTEDDFTSGLKDLSSDDLNTLNTIFKTLEGSKR